jgi:hypothetical protein
LHTFHFLILSQMKKIFLTILAASGIFLHAPAAEDGTVPVSRGKPAGRIIVTTPDAFDGQAARLLQDFVQRKSGALLPVLHDTLLLKNDIVIGNGLPNSALSRDGLSEGGFRICSKNGTLRILSGGGKGSVHGVAALLERFLGILYLGEREYACTPGENISIPAVDILENPAFRYRQSQLYAMDTDSLYSLWNRLDTPKEAFAANYWVHTFDRLLPSETYGKDHPEYYSFFNGRRHPGKASQWCLSSPEVLEIVTARLDSIFKANPHQRIISVSQNDGNHTNCQCDRCKAVDEREGAPSGSLIHFVNQLADRFPDREISTLAYLYTMKPPRHVKPRRNVNIMLCSIDCDREVSLTENASGMEFVRALQDWSRITDNIFVWDYGINFDNYLVPFPNFHILADNMRLFKKHHATMHFSQVAGSRGGDFAEMRTWLVSKLMWNPEYDTDSLMHVFLDRYYGAAAPHLYRCTQLMEGALIGSGQRLWIYDSPVSHKHGMLKPELMRRYGELFDRAEAAVAADSALLARVQRSRLPLQYSALDIARTEAGMDVEDVNRRLDLFERRVRQFDVPVINERENTPLSYCRLYRERYMPTGRKSLALGAKITWITPPSGKYAALGETALTDGLYGGATFTESWVGWEGIDGAFVVDLKERKKFTTIRTDFLHQLGQWILLPVRLSYSVSSDGKKFRTLKTFDIEEDRDAQVKFADYAYTSEKPLNERYIRIEVTGTKTCPHWHYGVGHPCWFFIDEVVVE